MSGHIILGQTTYNFYVTVMELNVTEASIVKIIEEIRKDTSVFQKKNIY
jgi:MinD superfamily P-loop ATPase